MRRRSIVAVIAVLAVLIVPATANAGIQLQTKDWVQSSHVDVPCANGGQGDAFDFTGSIHAVITETVPPSGRATWTGHWNTDGLTATSTITGTVYQITGRVELGQTWLVSDPGTIVIDRQMIFQNAIGRGPSNNTYFMLRVHVTIAPSGAYVVDRTDVAVACR